MNSAGEITDRSLGADGVQGRMMDDRGRYETVKSRLKAMGQGTAQQVHDAIEPCP